MARLGDVITITPCKINPLTDENWLLNLDMVQQQTGEIIDYLFVDADSLDGSIVGFDTSVVLYSKLRPNLNKVVLPTQCGYCTSEMLPLLPNPDLLCREYLAWFLRSDSFVNWAITKTAGAKMPRLGTKELLSKDIPLPGLPTQRRIAATLDKVSDGIAVCRQMLADLDTLIKARFVEMFEQGNYDEVEFGNIVEFLRNGANIKQTKGASGIPITRIETLSNDVFNVDRLGYADIFELGKYEGYQLQKGDILISHINSVAYLGRAVQYRGQLGDAPIIHGMNLLCARIKDSFNSTYIEFFFKTPKAKDYISTITKKAVNQASITTSDLKKMLVPTPPIEAQNEFNTFVKQVDKSKFIVQQQLADLETLKKRLMQEYF